MANTFIIRELSERKGITLRELSKKIGMSEDGLQKILRKGSTSTANLEKIANALEVPISYFFEDYPGHQQINVEGSNNGKIKMIGRDGYSKSAMPPKSLQDAHKEIAFLKEKLLQNEKLLKEKERTIQILLQQK
jgi:transcriptional regulator with XRE-family HTH domain